MKLLLDTHTFLWWLNDDEERLGPAAREAIADADNVVYVSVATVLEIALKRANDIRVRRARLKRDLKDGRVSIEQILSNPPEYVSTAKVFDMLMAVPKFGRVKAARFLNMCRISQSKTVGGLSDRQRTELIGLFNR